MKSTLRGTLRGLQNLERPERSADSSEIGPIHRNPSVELYNSSCVCSSGLYPSLLYSALLLRGIRPEEVWI